MKNWPMLGTSSLSLDGKGLSTSCWLATGELVSYWCLGDKGGEGCLL